MPALHVIRTAAAMAQNVVKPDRLPCPQNVGTIQYCLKFSRAILLFLCEVSINVKIQTFWGKRGEERKEGRERGGEGEEE